MIIGMIDNATADLWITAYGAKSFEESGSLDGRRAPYRPLRSRRRLRRTAGRRLQRVAQAQGRYGPFRRRRHRHDTGGLKPWNVVAGDPQPCSTPTPSPSTRPISRISASRGSATRPRSTPPVCASLLTEGIRSFTTAPYVFMPLARAREIQNRPATRPPSCWSSSPGADRETVRRVMVDRLPGRRSAHHRRPSGSAASPTGCFRRAPASR